MHRYSVPWVLIISMLLSLGGIFVAIFVPLVALGIIGGGANNNGNDVNIYLGFNGSSRVAVRFGSSSSGSSLADALAFINYTSLNLTASDIQLVEFETEGNLQAGVARLLDRYDMDFIVREFNYTVADFPNDPFFANSSQSYLDTINATYAWNQSTGAGSSSSSRQIVVAVIDTGVELDHPDLVGQLWVNPGEIPGNGIDDDGNGYVDDVHGYDFAGKCDVWSDINDDCSRCTGRPVGSVAQYHGTHVAGIIGAKQNNGIGVSGVAPHVKLMILKISDCTNAGRLTSTAIFEAFDYATKMGADIVSCSFGNDYPLRFYPMASAPEYRRRNTRAYEAALKPLSDKGVLIMASAGNEDIDMDNLKLKGYDYAPCLVDLPTLVCVGATRIDDTKWEFSNYGSAVHVGSPGEHVYSTYKNSSYASLDGTSLATPLVSGEVALLLQTAQCPVDGASLKQILLQSSDYFKDLPFKTRSRINVGRAMDQLRALCASSIGGSSRPIVTVSGYQQTQTQRRLSGWDVTYHEASGNQFSDSISGALVGYDVLHPVDTTELGFRFRDAAAADAPLIVRVRSSHYLGVPGFWHFSIAIRDSPGTGAFLYANGQPLIDTDEFLCNATGWVDLEVRLAHPTPPGSYVYRLVSSVSGQSANISRWMDDRDSVAHVLRADLSKRWVVTTSNGTTLVSTLGEIASLNAANGTASAHIKLNGDYVLEALCPDCSLFIGSHVVDSEDCVPLVDTDKLTVHFRSVPDYLVVRYAECPSPMEGPDSLADRMVPLSSDKVYQWEYWDLVESSGHVGWVNGSTCSEGDECWGWREDPQLGAYRYAATANAQQKQQQTLLVPITGIADQNGYAFFDRTQVVDQIVFGSYAYIDDRPGCVACDPVRGVADTTLTFSGPECDIDNSTDSSIIVDGYYYTSFLSSFRIEYTISPCTNGIGTVVFSGGALGNGVQVDNTTTIHAPPFTQVPVRLYCLAASRQLPAVYFDVSTVGLGGWDANLFGRPYLGDERAPCE